MEPTRSDHSRLEERSLAMHRVIARKLLADPALVDQARENLRRWRRIGDNTSLALVEWETILSGPVDELAQFLAAPSETATRLRQSSPFCGILSEAERRDIYESFSTRAYHSRRQPNIE